MGGVKRVTIHFRNLLGSSILVDITSPQFRQKVNILFDPIDNFLSSGLTAIKSVPSLNSVPLHFGHTFLFIHNISLIYKYTTELIKPIQSATLMQDTRSLFNRIPKAKLITFMQNSFV